MKKLLLMLTAVFTLSAVVGGCGNSEPKAEPAKTQVSFAGSSTLAPVIAAAAEEFRGEFSTWNKADNKLPEQPIEIAVAPGGSGAGVKAVIDKTSDFGMLARELKDSERQQMPDLHEYKLGIDALTIAVNPENPILKVKQNLTSAEIKAIFAGEIKTWQQLDAALPAEEIVVIIRDLGGGAHEVFQNKIMGDTKVREDAVQAPSMGALAGRIMENKNAVGYASFGVVNQNSGRLATLSVDGITAERENILNGSYKIARPLICVANGELSPAAQLFIERLTSDKGRAIVEQMGFVPSL